MVTVRLRWLIAVLAKGLLMAMAAQAQEENAPDDNDRPHWNGTIRLTERGERSTPPQTQTYPNGNSSSSENITYWKTTADIATSQGEASATVSQSSRTESRTVMTGCGNSVSVFGSESQHSGLVPAGVSVFMDDETGKFRVQGSVSAGASGRTYEFQSVTATPCRPGDLRMAEAALGRPLGTVSTDRESESSTVSFEVEGQAEPGATRITGSLPFGPNAQVTFNLSTTCTAQGAPEILRSLEQERAQMANAAATEEAPLGNSSDGQVQAASPLMAQANVPLSAASVASVVQGTLGSHGQLLNSTGTGTSGLQRFAVRLNDEGQTLPTLDWIRQMLSMTCVPPGSISSAPVLLIGSVQWQGSRYRVSVRTVNTETGEIIATTSQTGQGGSAELSGSLASSLTRFVRG